MLATCTEREAGNQQPAGAEGFRINTDSRGGLVSVKAQNLGSGAVAQRGAWAPENIVEEVSS